MLSCLSPVLEWMNRIFSLRGIVGFCYKTGCACNVLSGGYN